jgi:hypothetical protein
MAVIPMVSSGIHVAAIWIMIRLQLFASLVLAVAAEAFAAQSGSTTSPSAAPVPQKPITLVGCVQPDQTKPEWFTLSDSKTGTTYRLSGANVKAYVWRNVRIVGGLVPSPNIAAQAGAIDQTKTAMASQGANPPGAGNIGSSEFNVTRVSRLTGSCAPKSGR